MNELKKCPFCGSEAQPIQYPDEWEGAKCPNHDCDLGDIFGIVSWNTRPIEDALTAELASETKWAEEYHAEAEQLRERCAELESRLDIGTGNMYDVVVMENERLRARCNELLEQCNSNYEPLRKQLEQQGLDQAGYEYATQIVIDDLRAQMQQAGDAIATLLNLYDMHILVAQPENAQVVGEAVQAAREAVK